MNKLVASVGAVIVAIAGASRADGRVVFADDFSASMTLQENWRLKNDKPCVADGKLRLPVGSQEMTWNGVVPPAFVLEMTMTVKPACASNFGINEPVRERSEFFPHVGATRTVFSSHRVFVRL